MLERHWHIPVHSKSKCATDRVDEDAVLPLPVTLQGDYQRLPGKTARSWSATARPDGPASTAQRVRNLDDVTRFPSAKSLGGACHGEVTIMGDYG